MKDTPPLSAVKIFWGSWKLLFFDMLSSPGSEEATAFWRLEVELEGSSEEADSERSASLAQYSGRLCGAC
ncbi:hypothetical protein GN956_G23839 [Arapaima gigas]